MNTRVVLITGASSGIGLATARAFAKRGARLVLGSRDPQAGEAVIRELGAETALFRATDVARAGDMKALVATALERFGRLDVAVNNAAVEARGSIDSFDEAMYTRVFDANVKGMFFAMEAEIAAMRKTGGGSIINLSSTAGHRGAPGMSIYAASKHAVEGLSKAAALEVARDGIRVNVVASARQVFLVLAAEGAMNDAIVALHAAGQRSLAETLHAKLRMIRCLRRKLTKAARVASGVAPLRVGPLN